MLSSSFQSSGGLHRRRFARRAVLRILGGGVALAALGPLAACGGTASTGVVSSATAVASSDRATAGSAAPPPSATSAQATTSTARPSATSATATSSAAQPSPAPTLNAAQQKLQWEVGKLVDVGGYHLRLRIVGQGTPTILMDAGRGDDLSTWSAVAPDLSNVTRVATYDRAGMGLSDPDPNSSPRTSDRIVKDLHTLLANAHVAGPFVLVGHSFGGINMRLFASRFPDTVAGMVLVDSSHEDQYVRWDAVLTPSQQTTLKNGVADNPESLDLDATYAQMRAATPIRNIPLIVLSHTIPPDWETAPGWPTADLERIWGELQADLTHRSSKGKRVSAERSGHYIQQDRPDLVIAAVREVVATVRQG